MSTSHPHDTPTVALSLLDHEFDADGEAAVPRFGEPLAPAPAPEPPSITTPAGRRAAIALSIAAGLLFVVLIALLVLPTGVGRPNTGLAAFGSPTVPVTGDVGPATELSPTTTSTPDSTATIPAPPPTLVDVPSTVTTRRPPSTTAPTVPPTTVAPTTSSTTSTTTPKPAADITTLTGSKIGVCMVPATKLQVLITYATTNTTSVELSVDGGPRTALDKTSGAAQAPFTCDTSSHTYTLFAHGPGGDMKQAITVSS
jgi:hypothetical protein